MRRTEEQIAADEVELQRLRAQVACHRVIDILEPLRGGGGDALLLWDAIEEALAEARKGVQE